MQLLDLTLATPEENLALDEALLEEAEASVRPVEVLRLWDAAVPMVVVGRSSRLANEVDLLACQARGVPVLRRASGGAAIVTGPGCLMYAVVLSYELRPGLRSVDQAHHVALASLVAALRSLGILATRRGTSDLAVDERKVSGNSLRCKRRHLLYHGTLLYDFSLPLVEQLLRMPPRRPQYRHDRSHGEFLINLSVARDALRQAIISAWGADTPLNEWPRQRVRQIVAQRYGRPEWNEDP
jgi:lipoate---protein ligase